MDLPLDHNFPEPILNCLDEYLVDVRLLPLRHIDPRLPDLDNDRVLLIALYQLGFSSLVTTNYRMLDNPRELAAVLKTKFTVYAVIEAGHDPLKATGILLFDLPAALRKTVPKKAQIFRFRHAQPRPTDPWHDEFKRVARNRNQGTQELYSEVRVSPEELATPILE